MLSRLTVAVALFGLTSCTQRSPDFVKVLAAPSGALAATFSTYQPRGTIEGYLTVTLAKPGTKNAPQLTFGHMLNVRAGWIDDHTFALVYDALEPRSAKSPIYPSGEAGSAVELVTCGTKYLDCSPLLRRFAPSRTLVIKQFPDGGWPQTS
jgi:hypothetical protein